MAGQARASLGPCPAARELLLAAHRHCIAQARSNTEAARSLDPAVEARSCAGSGLRGAVSASGSGGQIWWGDLAPGPDPSIWPPRRGLTQDLAGGARCWDLAQHGQILGSGQQARSCVRSGHAGGISHWGVTFHYKRRRSTAFFIDRIV